MMKWKCVFKKQTYSLEKEFYFTQNSLVKATLEKTKVLPKAYY